MKNKKLIRSSAILFAVLLFFNACKKDKTTIYNDPSPQPVSTTNFPVNVMGSWTTAAPKSQKFSFDATQGNWVTGANGCKFYFPANSLLDMGNNPVTGNVDIELIEYMTKAEMLFAGVTVTSGNQLLESGGMFYLMARKNGAELHLKNNVGFRMEIPQTNNTDDPMDIWEGELNNGDSLNRINWVKKDTVQIVPKIDSAQHRKKYFVLFDYFKFGYCNIDREWGKFKTKVTKFRVKMPDGCNDTNSTALLLFKNYNCCAWCYWIADEDLITSGYQLPSGEVVKVLVYKRTGDGVDDLEYAVRELTFTDDTRVEFTSLVKCTNAELEAIIKGL